MCSDGCSSTKGLLVHEWIEKTGGAEKVLDALVELFPNSDVYCLWNDDQENFTESRVKESWLAGTAFRGRKSLVAPLLPALWKRAHLTGYDWALASSHFFAHHVASNRNFVDVPTFVYAHTPARYIWAPELDNRGSNLAVRAVAPLFRSIDKRRAKRVTAIAANSEFVRRRISETWERDARVIQPPVDVMRILSTADWSSELIGRESDVIESLPDSFLLGASRLVPYKRLDSVIKTGEVSGLPVVIAGSGPDLPRLEALAAKSSTPVHFMGRVSDAFLFALYQRALAFVFPAIEDFGIMPVEAMAAGTPVIATTIGGAAESVVDRATGALANFDSREEILAAIDIVSGVEQGACIARALDFDKATFHKKILNWLPAEVLSPTGTQLQSPQYRKSGG
ncbi:glycosyltransferase [Arthrobacter sp. MPF02]|uniref:glycosyltransferase n=1 Tax=Arthrobacter sp. MPF02 TaxID=3388492 RepID=UPI003984A4D5